MADITLRAVGANATGTSSVSVAQPTGTTTGDVLVAFIIDHSTTDAQSTAPTGWQGRGYTRNAAGRRFQVFTAVVGQNSLGASPWSFTGLTTRSQGMCIGYYNADTTGYGGLDTSVSVRDNASGTYGTLGITTATNGAMIIAAFGSYVAASTYVWTGESCATIGALNEKFDNKNSTYCSIAVADLLLATAGATGASTATPTSGQNNGGILLALKPIILSAIGDEVQKIWNIRMSIGDTSQKIWNVRQAVPDTSQSIWNIRFALGDTSQSIWNVKTTIGDTTQSIWNVLTYIGDTVQEVWHIRSLVAKTVQVVHNVRAVLSDISQYVWNVLEGVPIGDTFQLVWNIKSLITDQIQQIWNTRQVITDTIQNIWNTRYTLGKSNGYVWNVRQVINQTRQTIWKILSLASDNLQSIWNIQQAVGRARQVIWNINISVYKSRQYIWNVLSNVGVTVSDTVQFVWGVKQAVADSLQSLWNISTVVIRTKEFIWNLRRGIANEFQSLWNLRQANYSVAWQTIGLQWNDKNQSPNRLKVNRFKPFRFKRR